MRGRTVGAVVAVSCLAAGTAWPEPPKFGQDKAGPTLKAIPFDGKRAAKTVKELIDLGPRISGSEGMKKQQERLVAHFEKHGATIVKQTFEAKQFSQKNKVTMTNLVAQWFPERPRRVILCTHYDTRPMAHEEPDRRNWNRTFDSANDGTSGVAFLMELAPQMKEFPTTFGVDFVFFDGEEYIFEPTGALGGDKFFFGSEHFADEYRKSEGKRKHRYEAAILFDLFAAKGATLRVEGHSWGFAPKLAKQLWDVAAAVKSKSFKYEQGPEISDDHLALNRVGIPAVDLIDFDGYRAHWHRLSDTHDKISGEQMADVAGVVTAWLQLIQ